MGGGMEEGKERIERLNGALSISEKAAEGPFALGIRDARI
jgi:hypothetical protein